MATVTVKERIEQWKLTAEIFLNDNIKAYIRDMSDTIYFCKIIFVGDDTVTVQCFGPEQRRGEKKTLYWPLISKFDKYDDGGGG